MSKYIKEKPKKTFDLFSKYTKTQLMLFLTILSTFIMEINIVGINISWVLALVTIIFYIRENLNNKKPIEFKNNKIEFLFWFFIFWLVYGTVQFLILKFNAYAVSFYIVLVVNAFLVLMVLLTGTNKKTLLFYNRALIIGLCINLAISIWEITTGKHLIELNERNQLYYAGRALGVFGNGNDLSAFISLGVIAVLIDLFLTKKNKLISTIIILVSAYVVYVVDARASVYALIILGIFLLFFRFLLAIRNYKKEVFTTLMFIGISGCCVVAAYVIMQYKPETLLKSFSSAGNFNSDLLRVQLSVDAVKMFIDSHFLGVGPGQSIWMHNINVHNFILEILAEYGLIAFGVVAMFVSIFKGYKTNLPPWISALFMAFIPFFAFIAVASSSTNKHRIVWVLLSIMFLLVNLQEKVKDQPVADIKKGYFK